MALTTYSDYQALVSSEKCALGIFEATVRAANWSVYSGSVYRAALSVQKCVSVTQSGTALTEVASVAAITSAGKWYYDRQAGYLYAWCSASANPDAVFMSVLHRYYFSNLPATAPHDLSTGYEVYWLPLLDGGSEFTFEIENSKQLLGVGIASASGIKLLNDRAFWDPIYDFVTFESQGVWIYSWNRQLPITEAKLIYRGKVTKRTYSDGGVSFELRNYLDDLRAPVSLTTMDQYGGAHLTDALKAAYQRRVYGYVNGHVPTPIDQYSNTAGWTITGTLTALNGSTAVTGSGTNFLGELSPGDDILIGTAGTKVRIETVTDNTNLVLTESFAQDSQIATTASVIPSSPKSYINRRFLIAGHALSRPTITVTAVVDNSTFSVSSTAELLEGDILEYSGSQGTIRVLGDGLVKLETAFTGGPLPVGATLYRSSVGNVYLDGVKLTLTRDYTYDASTALLTLTSSAEFNVAPARGLTGTLTCTNGSRSVTGTGTLFRTELKDYSWIRFGSGSWYEVLEVLDDTNLTLRTGVSASDAGPGQSGKSRTPEIYRQGTSVLTCDVLGKADGSGNFMRYAGSIAKDLLQDAGLTANLDTSSFTTADSLLPHRIGLAIPEKYGDKRSPALRDVLSKICRSVFASIVLNEDFQLQMSSIDPSYSGTPTEFTERDAQSIKVESDSSQIVSATNLQYAAKERDAASGAASSLVHRETNDQYLASTEKELQIDTYLIDEDDATIMGSRWAYLLSKMNSDLQIVTGLQGARLQVFDVLNMNHEKL